MGKKIFLIFLILFVISEIAFSKNIILYNNSIDKNFSGKVIGIDGNKVTLQNIDSEKTVKLNLNKDDLNSLQIGDTVLIKKRGAPNNSHHFRCKCRNIRERIKQIAEKRRKIHRIHKGSSNNFMHRHGRK